MDMKLAITYRSNKPYHYQMSLGILFNTDLQDTTLALDFRVTVLEENGGGDGNSSVAELEVRVETLEGTADDHETRISATESDLTGSLRTSSPLKILIQSYQFLTHIADFILKETFVIPL